MRYTWGMHQYLRRLLKRRRRPPVRIEITAARPGPAERALRQFADPSAPLAYRVEPTDQEQPGWGPAPYRKHAKDA